MKRNIDGFDGMKDFIISIIGAVAWFLMGTIVIVGYFTIETKGESIVISLISMFFTIVSSLGIAATIGVYIWQKNDNNRKIENKTRMAISFLYDEVMIITSSLEKNTHSLSLFSEGLYNEIYISTKKSDTYYNCLINDVIGKAQTINTVRNISGFKLQQYLSLIYESIYYPSLAGEVNGLAYLLEESSINNNKISTLQLNTEGDMTIFKSQSEIARNISNRTLMRAKELFEKIDKINSKINTLH